MKTRILLIILFLIVSFQVWSIENYDGVVMPEEKGLGTHHNDYSMFDKGFFFATELQGGYSLTGGSGKGLGLATVNLTGGYRFSEYLRAGVGIGPRFYFDNHYNDGCDGLMRNASGKIGLALYVNVRGNFIPSDYRTIVPYWSFNLGGSFPDGFFANPTVGVRIGEKRSAFLLGIAYALQGIRNKKDTEIKHSATSFLMLNIGYEF